MNRWISLLAFALLGSCDSQKAVSPRGDDPAAIVGTWRLSTINGAAVPAEIWTSDTLTVQMREAWIRFEAPAAYFLETYIYERWATHNDGIPLQGGGAFALAGNTLTFDAVQGLEPVTASLVGQQLRVVQSVRAGRAPDTLVYDQR